jgi:hypothetical protein
MRILKYIFILIILAFIGITVYVATQKGDFEISKTSLLKTQRSTIFDYVNDYKNWETFGSWMTKPNMVAFTYPSKTMGIGGSCSWANGTDVGNIKTFFAKENDSLLQKINYNGTKANLHWSFKDTIGGTKISIYCHGDMDVMTKIKVFFKGGISSIANDVIEKSLLNLDKTLAYEMKTYTIKVNGIEQRSSGFCLKQTVSCTLNKLPRNIKIIMSKMVHFFKKNKIPQAGKPFVMYDRYDPANDFVTFSVCIPTTTLIEVMPGSDITSGEIIPFTCLKTTLIGDYSHNKEAWTKAKKYMSDNQLIENFAGKYTEVYVKTIDDIKQPSKWITEIYMPVFPKAESNSVLTTATIPSIAPTNSSSAPNP